MRPEQSVVEGVAEPQRREVLVEHLPRFGRELQLDLVVHGDHGALVRVRLRAELDPALVIAKVDALVLRVIDVAGPEEPDVAMLEHVLAGLAPECDVDVVRRHDPKARPALEMKGRGFILVELSLAVRDLRQGHREVARLEEDLGVAPQVLVAVEDVLEVEPGDGEEWLPIRPVDQVVDAVVSRAVPLVGLIVTDDRREIARPEGFVRHGGSPAKSKLFLAYQVSVSDTVAK